MKLTSTKAMRISFALWICASLSAEPMSDMDPQFVGPSFIDGGIEAIQIQKDGKIIIAGGFTEIDGVSRRYLARLNPNGSLDQSFDPSEALDSGVTSIALQQDGKIVAGGWFTSVNGGIDGIARFHQNGTVDPAFFVPEAGGGWGGVGTGKHGLVFAAAYNSIAVLQCDGSSSPANTNRVALYWGR